MTTPRAFIGLDFGTSNISLSYILDDPQLADAQIVRAKDARFVVSEDGTERALRVPTLLAADADDPTHGVLTGWRCWQRLRDRDREDRLLRHGENYFRSVKSDLGANRCYPRAYSDRFHTPERVAGQIIDDLLDEALAQMPGVSRSGLRVVLTVPAALSEPARRATVAAAVWAGIRKEQIEMIDEPVAALIDLLSAPSGRELLSTTPRTIALYDYGGGTLDITVVQVALDPAQPTGLRIHTLAVSPYARLGGDVVDQAVMKEVVWPQVEEGLGAKREALSPEIRQCVEDTLTPWVARGLKEALCDGSRLACLDRSGGGQLGIQASFAMPGVSEAGSGDGRLPGEYTIGSCAFEALLAPLIKSGGDGIAGRADLDFPALLKPLLAALDVARLDPLELDTIVLHGGGCRNPYVCDLLVRQVRDEDGLFPRAQILQTPDLDASVARGAAIACYWKQARNVTYVVPVISEEIGVVTVDDRQVKLIDGGVPLPYPPGGGAADVETGFSIAADGQRRMLVPFYAGRARPGRLVGTVPVDLPSGLKKGDEVRLRICVDTQKLVHWWYAVKGGAFQRATPLLDPWAPRELTGAARALHEHRGELRADLRNGGYRSLQMQMKEASLLLDCDELDEAELLLDEIRMPKGDAGASTWHNLKALMWSCRGDKRKACEHMEKAVALKPGAAILRGNLGSMLQDVGDVDAAIAHCRGALSRDPSLVYMHTTLADLYRVKGDEGAAKRELTEAHRLATVRTLKDPELPRTWHQLANVLEAQGAYEAARGARAQAGTAQKNERYGGDHTQRIAGPVSGLYLDVDGVIRE